MDLFMTVNSISTHKKDYLPLWEAMSGGKVETVEIFLSLGADPDKKCTNKGFKRHTFLQYAAKNDYSPSNHQIAEVLVRHGADVNFHKKLPIIRLPLIDAVARGNLPLAELLLKNGARLSGSGWDDDTPARFAFLIKDAQVCKEMLMLLYKYGLDVGYHNSEGQNLLHMFLDYEDDTKKLALIAEILLDFGIPVDELSRIGSSPLHRAFFKENYELATIYLKKGANINLYNKPTRKHPLSFALFFKNMKLFDFILSNGADPDSTDEYGYTTLHYACMTSRVDFVRRLIQHGADITKEGMANETAFISALLFDKDDFNNDTTVYMLKLISKFRFENRPVPEVDITVIQKISKLSEMYKECISELTRMKETKFYASYTYYSVLNKTISAEKLARIVRNEEFVKAFEEKLSFSYYKDDLQQVLGEAIKIRDETRMVYFTLYSVMGNFLPDIVLRKLTEYLKINDLPQHEATLANIL